MEISATILNENREICAKADNTKIDDRISQLLEDVLSLILSFFTMKNAVRTKVLSRRWRHVCSSSSNFDFDILTIFGIKYDYQYLLANRNKLWEGKFRFVRAVDQFLQVCGNSKIYSLSVCYCLGDESAGHIDKWVSFAVRMHTEKLELKFSVLPEGCELYNFPCHLLPEGKASQLKHLCLHGCMLRPSKFTNCFNSLKSLDLDYVPLDQSAFDDILSSCINLEWLKLKYCRLLETVSICGPLSLKSLILDKCLRIWEIKLSSIDLKTFEYIGISPRVSYVDIPSLEKLRLWLQINDLSVNYVAYSLPKDHPRLQTLVLHFETHMPIPPTMNQFSHLIELELFVLQSSDFDLLSIAFFLNASPYLQKFHLALQQYRFKGPMVRTTYDSKYYPQLKQVEISGFHDKCNALELAKYLLNTAVGLERMIINKQIRQYGGGGYWIDFQYQRCPAMDESEKKWIQSVLSIEKFKANVELILL